MDDIRAELAARNLIGRYADAIHRRDPADWGATWAEGAKWYLPTLEEPTKHMMIEGRQAIVGAWEYAMKGFPVVNHMVHSGYINAREMTGRWYLSEYLHTADGNAMRIFGMYDDIYDISDGKILFGQRKFSILYQGPADARGNVVPHPGGQLA